MRLAKPRLPFRLDCLKAFDQRRTAFQLNGVALAVIEAQGFDALKARQSPCEARRGILSAGKQHQGRRLGLCVHAPDLSPGMNLANVNPPSECRNSGWANASRCGIERYLSSFRYPMKPPPNPTDISALLQIMAALRTPGTGCPWDLEQTFETIAPYTIEEAHEVADAIERRDLDDLRDELGDLLLQVVFAFGDVVGAIVAKMIRRHPHVFGQKAGQMSPAEVKESWGRIKAEEKAERAAHRGEMPASLLASVKAGQPALAHALALQEKASTVGFDWNDPRAVLAKIREEADEIEAALDQGDAKEIAAEAGDLLFAVVNLARHAKADPEMVLRAANVKFERRFNYIEQQLSKKGVPFGQATLDEMEVLWCEAKAGEKSKAD